MTAQDKTQAISEAQLETDRNFDSGAYAKEVMRTVGADFHEDDPLFQTNEFRMHCYKILPCTKHFCHDWSVCPFAHFSERAKRRDPKDVKYTAIACPDMKKGENCPRGDRCPYSHNTFEYWLHPTRYRTRLCRDAEACNRKICFFAHKPDEVRVPTSRPSLPVAEELWAHDEFAIKTPKEAQNFDVIANSVGLNTLPTATDTVKLDQMSQLQAILHNANLSVNITPKAEPTFVDQVLNGLIPSSNCAVSELSLSSGQIPQMAQVSQNLSFDSCFGAKGFSQGADFDSFHHPNTTTNAFLQSHDTTQGLLMPSGSGTFNTNSQHQFSTQMDLLCGTNQNFIQTPSPFTAINPIAQPSSNSEMLSWSTGANINESTPGKTADQYTEMLRLLSSIQMANSPTSVLGNVQGLQQQQQRQQHQQPVSIDSISSISSNSGIGMTDGKLEKPQIGDFNDSMLANQGPAPFFGMTI